MSKLYLTPQAKADIDDIIENVIEFTGFEQSGIRLYEDIFDKLELIAYMPGIGVNRNDGTLESFVRNYRIVYKIINNDVYVLTVIHTRRLYPRA